MKQLFPFLLLSQFLLHLTACQEPPEINCLPENRKLTDIVSREQDKIITVADKLQQFQARCENEKIVDSSGKEIRFYELTGCWGNAPANYQEILAQQAAEIETLREQYTLILMTCNPDGVPFE